MTEAIIIAVFVIGYVPTWRRLTFWFAKDAACGRVSWGDAAFGVVMGTVVAIAWPAVAVLALVRRMTRDRDPLNFLSTIGSEPHAMKKERLRREAKERERYITRLEVELGIGVDERPR